MAETLPLVRRTNAVRPDWLQRIQQQGLTYHTPELPFWQEGAHYVIAPQTLDAIARASTSLHAMAHEVVSMVIEERRFAQLGITPWMGELIADSWQRRHPALLGRFDFSVPLDGGPPQVLEYNADTPVTMLEAGLIQRTWRDELFPGVAQASGLEEHLRAAWARLRTRHGLSRVYFIAGPDAEDVAQIVYHSSVAAQAGITPTLGLLEEVRFDDDAFRGVDGARHSVIYKLYPWEWFVEDPAIDLIHLERDLWIEPPWKLILQHKGLLAMLWELFPGHPNLLEAGWGQQAPASVGAYVAKPVLGREGQNVTRVLADGTRTARPGDYGHHGWIWQRMATLPVCDGRHPVIGAWVIGDRFAGLGIRESEGPVTDHRSPFTPHLVTTL